MPYRVMISDAKKERVKANQEMGRLSSDPPEFRTQEISLAAAPQNVWETN